ncbi:hypothetical protein C0995_002556 [Termitomyces sp. Mi166|nr:hypothetical protein C0995_002556 [Termitomyces sp. Mi166\
MQTAASRSHPIPGSSSSPSQRVPRRSSSFLSLRRGKDKSSSLATTSTTFNTSGPTYFDVYPRTKPRSSLSTKTTSQPETSAHLQDSPELSFAFPVFDSTDDFPTTPTQHPRLRSRTGPSGRSTWEAPVPQLRFSGSSSTQHTETPLHTPVDFNHSGESFEPFPVVVAAPIAGVETMDALVDGLNGGDAILSHTSSLSDRARFGVPGHHPLYQPPLPTPPPGIVLGRGKSRRRTKRNNAFSHSSDSDAEDETPAAVSGVRPRPRRSRPSPTPSSSETFPFLTTKSLASQQPSYTVHTTSLNPPLDKVKSIVPSISEIIRTHAPPEGQVRSRPSTSRTSSYYAHSQGHTVIHEAESEPGQNSLEEETGLLSRSSIDSVADEVQRTLRNQLLTRSHPPAPPPSSFMKRRSTLSDNASTSSPRSDPGVPSIYSSSICSNPYPASPIASFVSLTKPPTSSHEVVKYLRSARLTTLLSLTRSPYASADNPLTVSLSDLGSPTGHPVVVFLGLGCVRHIMGLYDEMAEILNLRLITIDRWGLGRTESRSKSAKGVMQWASVVEEVLDLLHIRQCSVMAHSAGGYKWLKYVPNGILKTAQAAEWKIQAWMIGKPPAIAYEGIGYHPPPAVKSSSERRASSPKVNSTLDARQTTPPVTRPRPSIGSSTFSDYDDLRDFDGRFESRSTLGAGPRSKFQTSGDNRPVNKRKTSRGFLDRFKGSSRSPQSPSEEKSFAGGKKLKALRSMGSLKSRSVQKKSEFASPQLPSLQVEVGLGFGELDWPQTHSELSLSDEDAPPSTPPKHSTISGDRTAGRRSISFSSPNIAFSMPSSPLFSTTSTASVDSGTHQAALGNALIAASHAESAKGTHNDLLQILNHDNQPWGFSYSSYPHHVKVWYGDRDEKIAEHAVRWMASNMGENRCSVEVVKGADHGLMYRSSVVVEVLENVLSFWKTGCYFAAMSSRRPSPSPQKRTTALKRADGEPLTRFDIQYDVLHHIFHDVQAVFTDPYPSGDSAPKVTFRNLYIKTILHSPKATKALKDRMTESETFAEDFAMLALLVNVGRVNTTMSFFPEMKTAIRTYHPIPSLQRTTGNLQDAPRIKHILKSATLGNDHPTSSTPADILSRVPIGRTHFSEKLDFTDLFIRETLSSLSRARAFLWLCYHYLESSVENNDDDYDDDSPTNPFADSRRGNIPTIIHLSDAEIAQENVDSEEEKTLAEKLVMQRLEILKTQGAKESSKHSKMSTHKKNGAGDGDGDSASAQEGVKLKIKRIVGEQIISTKEKTSSTIRSLKLGEKNGRDLSPTLPDTDEEYDLIDSTHAKNQHPGLKHPYHPQLQPESHTQAYRVSSETPEPRDPTRRYRRRYSPYPSSPSTYQIAPAQDHHMKYQQRLSTPPRSMLEQAWHIVTTTDPLLDSDEEGADEHLRYDYSETLSFSSTPILTAIIVRRLKWTICRRLGNMANSSYTTEEEADEVYHVEVITRARVAPPSSDEENEDDQGMPMKRRKKGKNKELKKPKWEYLVEVCAVLANSSRVMLNILPWEPEENVAGCQRLLASFWAHVGTDDNDYDIGYEVAADEKWIKKEKRFFRKEYDEAEENLRKQRERDERSRRKKPSIAMSDEDSDDDKPLIAKRKREAMMETSDDDILLIKLPPRKKMRTNSLAVGTDPNFKENWAASLFSSPEPEATSATPALPTPALLPTVIAPAPLPVPAPLPLPPLSLMVSHQHFPQSKVVETALENVTSMSSLSTKQRLSLDVLAPPRPPKVISLPVAKPKNQRPLPRSSSSASLMPLSFKKSTVSTSALIPTGSIVDDAQVSTSPPRQDPAPTMISAALSPNQEHLDRERLPEGIVLSHNTHMEAADAFLREIMPPALAGPLKPAEERSFEPQPPRSLVLKATPALKVSQPPWTWSGNVFTETNPSKPVFAATFYDVTAFVNGGLRLSVTMANMDRLHFSSFHDAVDLYSMLLACQGAHQFARLGPKSNVDAEAFGIFSTYMAKMRKLKPPSEVQRAGSLVAALVPWTLSSGQLSRHHRHPANENLPAQAEMDPLVKDETQWVRTLRIKPRYHYGIRLLKFPRSLHTYLSDDGHERTFSVWFEGGDGTKKKPGLETIILFKILEKCRTKHTHIRDARIIFIHVGAIERLEKLPSLLQICSSSFSVQFYTYGTHETISSKFWGIREIYPCGGIVTFTPQALLDDPIGVQHRIDQIHSHPMWECYILPSVLGMVAKLYCQNKKNDPIADLDSGKFPYTRLLHAIDEGELSFITSPSSYGLSTKNTSSQQEWLKRQWTHRPHGPRAILQASLDAFHEKYANFHPTEWDSGILDEISKDLKCMRRQPCFMEKYRRYVVLITPRVRQGNHKDALEWTSPAKFDFKDDFFPLQE